LENRRVDRNGGRGIALGDRGRGFVQHFCHIGAAGDALRQFLDEGLDLAFRHRAHETIDRLAVDEGDHGWDRLNAHLAGNLRVLVDVHLDEFDLAFRAAHRVFEDRAELLARPAPRRPEIDHDRLALGFLQHILHEGLCGGILDEVAAVRGSGIGVKHRHVQPSLFSACNSATGPK